MLDPNPALSPLLRVFAIAVILVLIGGSLLLIYPAAIVPYWPWRLAPFTARFLGAFYLAEMAAIGALACYNRWTPARLVLVMAVLFTAIVSAVSLWHLDRFDLNRWRSWGWFAVYLGSAAISAYFLWRYRQLPHPGWEPPPALRTFFRAQALVLTLYGLALLLLPQIATGFWPWPIDRFHTQVYSAIFLTGGIGALLLSRRIAKPDLLAFGLAQVILGAGAIIGLLLADSAANVVRWSAPGTWLWLAVFAGFVVTGGVALLGMRRGPR